MSINSGISHTEPARPFLIQCSHAQLAQYWLIMSRRFICTYIWLNRLQRYLSPRYRRLQAHSRTLTSESSLQAARAVRISAHLDVNILPLRTSSRGIEHFVRSEGAGNPAMMRAIAKTMNVNVTLDGDSSGELPLPAPGDRIVYIAL